MTKLNQYFIRICIALLLTQVSGYAQKGKKLVVLQPTGISDLEFFTLDSQNTHADFSKLFSEKAGAWDYFRPFSLIVANRTSERIKGLTVAWTFTSAGKKKTVYTSSTLYFLNQPDAEVISPLSQALIVPTAIFDVSAFEKRHSIPLPDPKLIGDFTKSGEVSASIDVVIFETGRVKGPDSSRTIKNLEARDAATKDFVKKARAAISRGESLGPLLGNLAGHAAPVESSWQGQLNAAASLKDEELSQFWTVRLANQLLRSTGPAPQIIDRLAVIPKLPKFTKQP